MQCQCEFGDGKLLVEVLSTVGAVAWASVYPALEPNEFHINILCMHPQILNTSIYYEVCVCATINLTFYRKRMKKICKFDLF